MTAGNIVQRIHLWAGLLLGVQVVLWMLSGVVMTWFHLDLVRGERNAIAAPPPELAAENYASPGGVIAQTDGALRVELRYFMNRTVYEVEGVAGSALFDASTGQKLTPLKEAVVREVARTDFIGNGAIENIALMTSPPREYRGAQPVWRADFDDRLHTRLYISPDTGKVVSRRNDIWRIYDFFWMLHIMDYGERENFNHPLVQIAAMGGFLFSLTGLLMLIMKKGRTQLARDVRFLSGGFRRRSNQQT